MYVAPEKFLTVKEASEPLGLKPWQLHRAIAKGLIPTYNLHTKRKLVRLSDIVAFIEASRTGGAL